MCITNREGNAGFAKRKYGKMTGELCGRGGKNRCVGPHLPNAALFISDSSSSTEVKFYEFRVFRVPSKLSKWVNYFVTGMV